jgi:hypothetical protein
MRVD